MKKRTIRLGAYDTAINGWTLTGWNLSAAEPKTTYLDKPNGDGTWDLTTALTDGIVKYKDRSFTATFECSEGTRMERESIIRQMINELDGMKVEIMLPDDEYHYATGRLRVIREYNDLAHAAVTVTAICEPWKYSTTETVVTVSASETKQRVTLYNRGRRAVVPLIRVGGGPVLLEYGGTAPQEVPAGEHKWPSLLLTPGRHSVVYSGTGTVTFTYREAVLE